MARASEGQTWCYDILPEGCCCSFCRGCNLWMASWRLQEQPVAFGILSNGIAEHRCSFGRQAASFLNKGYLSWRQITKQKKKINLRSFQPKMLNLFFETYSGNRTSNALSTLFYALPVLSAWKLVHNSRWSFHLVFKRIQLFSLILWCGNMHFQLHGYHR